MSKQSKISVKHFLNTNLKPYVINGTNYFSIYMLVIANRKNTKIKSLIFDELYTENDFNEIISFTDSEDEILLNKEISCIENIGQILIDVLKEFDTTFFTVYYGFLSSIFIKDINFDYITNKLSRIDEYGKQQYEDNYYLNEDSEKTKIISLTENKKNSFNINFENIINSEISENENITKGMSLLTYFSFIGQDLLKNSVNEKSKITEINEINKLVFYSSLSQFEWILKGSKKNKELFLKFENVFFTQKSDFLNYFIDKYKT
ncbi:hypothetical protein [Flavobacterium psychrophilum]|uniref:Uncharacterized protein n=1 Tax=Flavobacterium psychrophilum TaxID=96345 RepID=A0A7U2NFU1_FLAPS|nr:hypothetical protein [Flavobacterium psychrophilum]OAE92111.1 hypothetical protein SU65_10165 [Flavobacterium psychrophilum]QRE04178.1 hypothetical protein H0H26_00805 [Flavobacterium psychrophilum]